MILLQIQEKTTADDPSAFVYATQVTELEFQQQLKSSPLVPILMKKVMLEVSYYISNNPDETPVFYPFPGFDNSDDLTREERTSE